MKFPKRVVNGIILLDKPQGLSSHQALQKVKHLLHAEKAGHTGSLDPMATGLLPLCFGEATKFASAGLEANKTYIATMKLGVQTDTGDAMGQVIATTPVPVLTTDDFQRVTQIFLGESQQIPPMYSALKRDGVPLYKIARQGEMVERTPRTIHLYDLQLTPVAEDLVNFQVTCSKGTYVRVLAESLANALGAGSAHLVALRRIGLGDITGPLYTLDALQALDMIDDCLLPMDSLLGTMPKVVLTDADCLQLWQGKTLMDLSIKEDVYRVYTPADYFVGLAIQDATGVMRAKRLVQPS